MAYLDRGDGGFIPANRDVVKLEVDFHCKKKPPRFPFPAETNQRLVRNSQWAAHFSEQFDNQTPAKRFWISTFDIRNRRTSDFSSSPATVLSVLKCVSNSI